MKKIIFFLVFLFGISCILGSLLHWQKTSHFIHTAIKTEGTVSDFLPRTNIQEKNIISPQITFLNTKNEIINWVITKNNPPHLERGDRLDILYNPENPTDAAIDSFWFRWSWFFFLALGMIITTLGVYPYWGKYFPIPWLTAKNKSSTLFVPIQKIKQPMKTVKIYTTTYCPYCQRAKALFSSLNIPYQEIDVENNTELRDELIEKYNWRTVPMIFIGEEFIGGFDDLTKLHGEGKLLPLLSE